MGKTSPLPSRSHVVSSSLASNWFSGITRLNSRDDETSDRVSLKRDRRDRGDSVVVLIRSDSRTEDDQPRFLFKGKQTKILWRVSDHITPVAIYDVVHLVCDIDDYRAGGRSG